MISSLNLRHAAMYGLLYFYHAVEHELHHIKPLQKLLCIKAVLFLSFWQGIVCALLAKVNIIHSTAQHSLEEIEIELQVLSYLSVLADLLGSVAVH
jgi:hypothetical protein